MNASQVFTFPALPTDIVFGFGVVRRLADHVQRLGGTRALIVTDPGVASAGILAKLAEELRRAGIAHAAFSDVPQDSSTSAIYAAVKVLRDDGCDVVIGVGGGSALDTAKAVAIAATNEEPITAFVGLDRVENPPLPVIAVPTTSGTGSEVSLWSVITDDATQTKVSVGGAVVFPRLALCDPELTMTLPPHLTASTGMDALTHAIESYVNNATQPISQTLSFRAIELIGTHLRTATLNGRDRDSRYGMMLGSTLAGIAMNPTRLGISHALAMPLGSWQHKVPHGIANAIALPHVMAFNLAANVPRFVDVARALGEAVDGLAARAAAQRSVEAVRQLVIDLGLPTGLRAFGLKPSDVPRIVEEAMKSGNIAVNPRLANADDVAGILTRAIEGSA